MKAEEIYEAIIEFALHNNYLPTIRQIGEIVGLKSTSSVETYMHRLEMKGLIKREDGKSGYQVKGLYYEFRGED